jgi:hypothetical protein
LNPETLQQVLEVLDLDGNDIGHNNIKDIADALKVEG